MGSRAGRGLLLAALLSIAGNASAGAINVFGDSLSDTGNLLSLTAGLLPPSVPLPSPFVPPAFTPPPYSDGRFSNGPVWVDQVAAAKGLALNNAFASFALLPGMGINNFAVGGAFTGSGNSSGAPLPGMAEQVGTFGLLTSGSAPADDLYVLWGGANDIVFASDILGMTPVDAAGAAAINVAQRIAELQAMGAENFMVMTTPDIGSTPLAAKLGPGAPGILTLAAQVFNTVLAEELADLQTSLGIQVTGIDAFSLVSALVDDPGAFGFDGPPTSGFEFLAAGIGPCLDQDVLRAELEKLGAMVPANPHLAFLCDPSVDPNRYIFHDVLHPSSATHAILAAEVLAAIPEPATLALVFLGLATLSRGRKRT